MERWDGERKNEDVIRTRFTQRYFSLENWRRVSITSFGFFFALLLRATVGRQCCVFFLLSLEYFPAVTQTFLFPSLLPFPPTPCLLSHYFSPHHFSWKCGGGKSFIPLFVPRVKGSRGVVGRSHLFPLLFLFRHCTLSICLPPSRPSSEARRIWVFPEMRRTLEFSIENLHGIFVAISCNELANLIL